MKKNAIGLIVDKTKSAYRGIKRVERNQRKLTLLISATTLSFYLTWTPYAITSILAMSGFVIHRYVTILSILFAKSGTILNPTFYIFFNKDVSIKSSYIILRHPSTLYLKYHLVKITNITNIIILDHPSKLQIYNSATESNTKKYNKYNTKLSEAKSCRDRNYQRVKKY